MVSSWYLLHDGVRFAMVISRRPPLHDGVRLADDIRGRACMAPRSWVSYSPSVRESKEGRDLHGQEVVGV